jgi:4-amino-4-deoxy-L-arabinose transferase-like glycosyltransferase
MATGKKGNSYSGILDTHQKIAVLFFLSLFLRLVFVLVFSDLYVGDWMDSVRYQRVASNINMGRGFSEYFGKPTAFVPPIYPYFLAGVYRVFGPHPVAVQLFQVLFGGLICLSAYCLASNLFGYRTGILAMIISTIYPEFIVMTGYLYTETLFMVFSCWSFVLIVRGMSKNGKWMDWVWGGILFGLGVMTRPVLIFFPIFLGGLVSLFRRTRIHFKKVIVFSAVAYALLIPWTIRNYFIFHAFVPAATGGGGEFWIGSYLPFEGKYHYSETQNQIRQLTVGDRNEVEKDRILYAAGLRNIFKQPFQYACVAAKKWFRFFFQIYENVPSGKSRTTNALVWIVLALSYYPILILACVGFFLVRQKWPLLLSVYGVLVYSSLLYTMVHVVPRYRIPLMPFFILLASFSLNQLVFQKSGLFKSRK